jgi:hypothetical protein
MLHRKKQAPAQTDKTVVKDLNRIYSRIVVIDRRYDKKNDHKESVHEGRGKHLDYRENVYVEHDLLYQIIVLNERRHSVDHSLIEEKPGYETRSQKKNVGDGYLSRHGLAP